jgi:general secretion pathway protein E
VRRLCPECREAYRPTPAEWAVLGVGGAPATVWRARGCAACNQTGYRGRAGVYELLGVDDAVRRLIHDGVGEHVVRDHARGAGMRTLREDGRRWLLAGETSIEELLRATRESA